MTGQARATKGTLAPQNDESHAARGGESDQKRRAVKLNKVDYEMRLESPTLDHYRLGWVPEAGVRLAGMWAPGVLTDVSGQDYLGLRGWSDFISGMTHTVSPFCGFRSLRKSL